MRSHQCWKLFWGFVMDTTTKAGIYIYTWYTCNVVQKVMIWLQQIWDELVSTTYELLAVWCRFGYLPSTRNDICPPPTKEKSKCSIPPLFRFSLHPWKLNMIFSKKGISFCRLQFSRFHVSFRGCKCERMRAQFDFLFEVISFGIALALLFLAVMVWWQVGDGEWSAFRWGRTAEMNVFL